MENSVNPLLGQQKANNYQIDSVGSIVYGQRAKHYQGYTLYVYLDEISKVYSNQSVRYRTLGCTGYTKPK